MEIKGNINAGYGNSINGNSKSSITGGRNNTITGGTYNIIGGGFNNNINSSLKATIGGGQDNDINTGNYSTVVGGAGNDIQGSAYSFVGGGGANFINNNGYKFIGGGKDNQALGSSYTIIVGGYNNIITGNTKYSSILSGHGNRLFDQQNAHIIGSNITSVKSNTTHVENMDVQDDLDVNNSQLYVNSTNGNIGINNPSPAYGIDFMNKNGQARFHLRELANDNTLLLLSGSSLQRLGVLSPYGANTAGITLGTVGQFAPTSTFGAYGDSFIYAGAFTDGLNIINAQGGFDFIRFYAGKDVSSSSDLHIQGTGGTKGFIGVRTEAPTSNLDINAANGYSQFRMRTPYTPTASGDTNGNVGDVAWDNTYFYMKTNTGWGRVLLDYGF